MSDRDNPKNPTPNPNAPHTPAQPGQPLGAPAPQVAPNTQTQLHQAVTPERTSGKCPTCGRDVGLDQLAEIEAAKAGRAPARAPATPPAPVTHPPAR